MVYSGMKYFAILMSLVVASMFAFGIEPEGVKETNINARARDYVFAMLILDQPDELSEDELKTAMTGHFSNMKVLAEQEKLLVAGPFGTPGISENHRGVYIFNTKSVQEAEKLVKTDPAVQAGVFRPELYLYTSETPLGELFDLKKKRDQKMEALPIEERGFDGRAYVWAVGPSNAEFADGDHVLIEGEMHNYQDVESCVWLLLDAETVDDALDALNLDDPDGWRFYGWYGSGVYADLVNVSATRASP